MSNEQKAVETYQPKTGAAVSMQNETSSVVLAARVEAEIKARTFVAISRPRNIDSFRLRLLESCQRSRFADCAMYAKPVGGKQITGLSIRFAEEAIKYYGNMEIRAMVVSEDDERRVFEVSAVDLETNALFAVPVVVQKTVERKNPGSSEVVRWRTNSSGGAVAIIRADDDALLVKQNALLAKAQREVILKHLPADVKEEAIEVIEATVKARTEQDPTAERKRILDGFFRVGVMPEQIVEFLGHSCDAINPAELHVLRRIWRGIEQGEGTWADVMVERRGGAKADAAKALPATTGGAAADLAKRFAGAAAAKKAGVPLSADELAEDRRLAAMDAAEAAR